MCMVSVCLLQGIFFTSLWMSWSRVVGDEKTLLVVDMAPPLRIFFNTTHFLSPDTFHRRRSSEQENSSRGSYKYAPGSVLGAHKGGEGPIITPRQCGVVELQDSDGQSCLHKACWERAKMDHERSIWGKFFY